MKLFRRDDRSSKPADAPVLPAPESTPQQQENPAREAAALPTPKVKSAPISLSDEHKSMLEKPLDSRVDQILHGIYTDQATAERALKRHRIIEFPCSDSADRHVIRGEDGFWRIVPVPAPMELPLSDRL
jgi:hypothetical protein